MLKENGFEAKLLESDVISHILMHVVNTVTLLNEENVL